MARNPLYMNRGIVTVNELTILLCLLNAITRIGWPDFAGLTQLCPLSGNLQSISERNGWLSHAWPNVTARHMTNRRNPIWQFQYIPRPTLWVRIPTDDVPV